MVEVYTAACAGLATAAIARIAATMTHRIPRRMSFLLSLSSLPLASTLTKGTKRGHGRSFGRSAGRNGSAGRPGPPVVRAAARRRATLALVPGPVHGRAVRVLGRRRQPEDAQLADLHPR